MENRTAAVRARVLCRSALRQASKHNVRPACASLALAFALLSQNAQAGTIISGELLEMGNPILSGELETAEAVTRAQGLIASNTSAL